VKFLADMGISMSTVASLREAGYDSVHLRDEGLLKMDDAEILDKARSEGRIVLAFDLDFGDLLAASRDVLPSVIIFRLRDQTPLAVRPRLLQILTECEADLNDGAIIVVEEARYRVRRLPIKP
jgi:predicted nuclease of predicted toxin-antitoxin system